MSLLFPYKRFSYHTSLQVAEVTKLLTKTVCPKKKSHRIGNEEGYVGKISGSYFTILRRPGYPKFSRYFWGERNSFCPVILGELYPQAHGTKVEIILRMHLLVLGFVIFACGSTLSAVLWPLFRPSAEKTSLAFVLGGVLMAVAIYSFALWAFASDARKAERFLDSLFAKHLLKKTTLDS